MNRWDTLTMGEKNQLLGIYASKGYNNLANIIAHYNSFAEGGNVDGKGDDIDNRTGKPRYRRDIHNVNITSSYGNNIEGTARDTSTIGPLAFYPPKYYIGKQGNQFEENPNVTYDSWFDEHPEMIDVMTDIVGRYNNRLNNRGQQLPQLNRYYFEKLYNPEDDPIIHEAIERMLQAKWNRDVRTYNDNRTLNLWDTVEKFPAANMRVDNEYQRGGKLTFQQWKSQMQSKYPNLEMDNNKAGYDYDTYFKENYDDAVKMLNDWGSGVHFTDRYKLINHPTFSDESMYSRGPNMGGSWSYDLLHTGEDIVPREKFNPSVINKQQHPELYAKGGHLYQGDSEPTQKMQTLYDEASDQIYGMLPEINISAKAPKGYKGYPMAFEKEYSDNGGIYGGFRNKDRAYKAWQTTQKYFSPENLDKYRGKGFKPFVPLVAGSMAAPAVVSAGAALAPIVAESAPIVGGYATKFGLPLATAITGGKALDDFIARNGDYRGFADWANQTLYRENATPENEEVLELFNPGYAVAGIPNATIKGINAINRAVESTAFGRNARITSELNKAIRNTKLSGDINFGNKTLNQNTRFRVGDVEMDNPNLMYHVDNGDFTGFSGNGAYVKDGILFPTRNESGQTPYTWWNLGRPYRNNQSRLLTVVKDNPNLLKVRDQNYPIGQWTGNPTEKSFVTNSEYVSSKPIKIDNQYEYIPNYGYSRVQEPTPTLEQAMQEARNARIEVPEVLSAREPFEMSNIPNWREILSNYNPNAARTVRTTTQSTEFNPDIFNFNKGNTDKRFEFFEPWKFINYDLTKMSTDEVVKTFGPKAKHLKELYDVAAANNFEGKYADIAKDVELKLSKMFAIDPKDVDIAAGLARAKGIYNIPEYTERFKKYGDLGETFIQDAKNRLDNIQLQGVSRNFKITGQYGVEGGASTTPHPIQPTITLSNDNRSSVIREFTTHEANHAAHGTKYQPKWMEVHNEKIRPVPKKNRKDFTDFDKYLDEMDELVERSKTAVEYAHETRLEGETLDQALDRVFEVANRDVYNSKIPSDIRQMVKNYTKDSVLKFWKQFLGGIALPTYISTRNEG